MRAEKKSWRRSRPLFGRSISETAQPAASSLIRADSYSSVNLRLPRFCICTCICYVFVFFCYLLLFSSPLITGAGGVSLPSMLPECTHPSLPFRCMHAHAHTTFLYPTCWLANEVLNNCQFFMPPYVSTSISPSLCSRLAMCLY